MYIGIRGCNAGTYKEHSFKIIIHVYNIFFIRSEIAVLHFNENANRKQATTKQGEGQYERVFPKFKKGGYIDPLQ